MVCRKASGQRVHEEIQEFTEGRKKSFRLEPLFPL
jgi:hypothetical protein